MPEPGSLQRVPDAAGVGEARLPHPAVEVVAQRRLGLAGQPVSHLAEHQLGDVGQLVQRVLGEVEVVGDPRAHPRVGGEEGVHPVLVAGQDHHDLVPLVLHHLQQDLDRLLAVVPLVVGPVQVVGLVDEQHAAHGSLEDLIGLGSSMADILADEVFAGDGDEVSAPEVAQALEQLGHA